MSEDYPMDDQDSLERTKLPLLGFMEFSNRSKNEGEYFEIPEATFDENIQFPYSPTYPHTALVGTYTIFFSLEKQNFSIMRNPDYSEQELVASSTYRSDFDFLLSSMDKKFNNEILIKDINILD